MRARHRYSESPRRLHRSPRGQPSFRQSAWHAGPSRESSHECPSGQLNGSSSRQRTPHVPERHTSPSRQAPPGETYPKSHGSPSPRSPSGVQRRTTTPVAPVVTARQTEPGKQCTSSSHSEAMHSKRRVSRFPTHPCPGGQSPSIRQLPQLKNVPASFHVQRKAEAGRPSGVWFPFSRAHHYKGRTGAVPFVPVPHGGQAASLRAVPGRLTRTFSPSAPAGTKAPRLH